MRPKLIGAALALMMAASNAVGQQFAPYDWSWRGLIIAPENRCTPYVRGQYSYPQTIEQFIQNEMGVAAGGWYGMYEARIFASGGETDIEHIVAVSEAHDSGMCARSAEERRAFASDLSNLTLASSALNAEKSGKDAAEWLPPNARCWFARTVVHVKRSWRLTVDEAEQQELERVLSACESGEVPARTAPPSTNTPDPPTTDHPPVQTFRNCTLMRGAGWARGVARAGGTYQDAWDDAERRTYNLNTSRDRDRDGHACE